MIKVVVVQNCSKFASLTLLPLSSATDGFQIRLLVEFLERDSWHFTDYRNLLYMNKSKSKEILALSLHLGDFSFVIEHKLSR